MNKILALDALSYFIKKISPNETYIVRHPVLRNGKPQESCIFDGDNMETTYHLGIYNDNKLVGVSSFFKSNHYLIYNEFQYQLRGMAILDENQNLGLGKRLLSQGETLLKAQNIEIIWCNAREKAVDFYKRNGYKIIGSPFDIQGIGQHFIMYKIL